jgi:hypothetical protein
MVDDFWLIKSLVKLIEALLVDFKTHGEKVQEVKGAKKMMRTNTVIVGGNNNHNSISPFKAGPGS